MLILRRNLMHMLVGLALVLVYLVFGRWYGVGIMAVIFLTGTYLQSQLKQGKRIPQLDRLLRFFETEDETENWRGMGAQTLVLGVLLTFILFPAYAAVPAVLVLSFADSASAIFGTYIKSANILEGRTVFGSLSFTLVALFILQFFVPFPLAVFVAISGALIELIPLPDDNLWIPLGVALILLILVPFF